MRIAHGSVTDRPWGLTLGTIARRDFTGQLTLISEDRTYVVAFDRGAIVAAASPLTADATVRIAITNHLVTKTQLAEITRRIAAAPARDEVEVLAETTQLAPEHIATLRRKVVAQRAARTFALDRGEFTLDDVITLPVAPGVALDVHPIIFGGARMNLSEQRMTRSLRLFGSHFTLAPEADAVLPRFGFTELERPVIAALRAGTSLPELEARHRDLDPRIAQAVIYALMSCGACLAEHREPWPRSPAGRTAAGTAAGDELPPASMAPPAVARTATEQPAVARTATEQPAVARTATEQPVVARTSTARRTQALIAARMILADQDADHFTLLGVPFDAPIEVVRTTYLNLVRQLHPDKLAELGVDDSTGSARRLFSRIGAAFTVLTDPDKRAAYLATLAGPPPDGPVSARTITSDAPLTPAAEALRRGESALRREQPEEAVIELLRAVELAPGDVDAIALLGWASFCAAADKPAVAARTRVALAGAIQRSQKPMQARFLLGRMERMLGRDHEALYHFQIVVDNEPKHAEAASEIRILEQRLASAPRKR